jgi:hypothetical protein
MYTRTLRTLSYHLRAYAGKDIYRWSMSNRSSEPSETPAPGVQPTCGPPSEASETRKNGYFTGSKNGRLRDESNAVIAADVNLFSLGSHYFNIVTSQHAEKATHQVRQIIFGASWRETLPAVVDAMIEVSLYNLTGRD